MDEVLRATVVASYMERHQRSVSDYLERFKKGHVLVLGDFSEQGAERIERTKKLLGVRGYFGFTLQDVPEVPEYDLRQKLAAELLYVGSLSSTTRRGPDRQQSFRSSRCSV